MLSRFLCFQECDTSVHMAVLTGSAAETPVLLLKRPHTCSSAVVLLHTMLIPLCCGTAGLEGLSGQGNVYETNYFCSVHLTLWITMGLCRLKIFHPDVMI